MIDALSTPRNRIRTLILLATCALLAIAAATVGIEDNPPGILLAFLAITAFVLAFVHPWRTSRQFRLLLYASALGLVVLGFLYVVVDISVSNLGGSSLLHDLLGIVAAILLIAILICPSGLLVGAVGAVVMAIKNRRRSTSGPTKTA